MLASLKVNIKSLSCGVGTMYAIKITQLETIDRKIDNVTINQIFFIFSLIYSGASSIFQIWIPLTFFVILSVMYDWEKTHIRVLKKIVSKYVTFLRLVFYIENYDV